LRSATARVVAFDGKAFLGNEARPMTSRVAVRAPFRLDMTANVLRRLSTNVVDRFEDGIYRRLIGDGATAAIVSVEQTAPDELAVTLTGKGAKKHDPAVLVNRLLGTETDLAPFYRAAAKVPWLAPLVAGARGVKPPRYPSVWEACVNAIVYQQVSIHAAGAILRRVIERYSPAVAVEGGELRAFPGPQIFIDAEGDELRSLGLSIQKVVSVKAVGQAILDGAIDEGELTLLPTPDLMESLTAHRGIGPWTAAVVALRGFGRLDLFPMNDSGVARSVKDLSGQTDVDVDALLKLLGPQRGMLYYHLLIGRLVARGDVELRPLEENSTSV
jgi:DNA-3-methyladenine glycosylase II